MGKSKELETLYFTRLTTYNVFHSSRKNKFVGVNKEANGNTSKEALTSPEGVEIRADHDNVEDTQRPQTKTNNNYKPKAKDFLCYSKPKCCSV